MRRAYYSSSISDFLTISPNEILGHLQPSHARRLQTQLHAWFEDINILKRVLLNRSGRIYFEYAIPRMGKRIDVVLLITSDLRARNGNIWHLISTRGVTTLACPKKFHSQYMFRRTIVRLPPRTANFPSMLLQRTTNSLHQFAALIPLPSTVLD